MSKINIVIESIFQGCESSLRETAKLLVFYKWIVKTPLVPQVVYKCVKLISFIASKMSSLHPVSPLHRSYWHSILGFSYCSKNWTTFSFVYDRCPISCLLPSIHLIFEWFFKYKWISVKFRDLLEISMWQWNGNFSFISDLQ